MDASFDTAAPAANDDLDTAQRAQQAVADADALLSLMAEG